MVKKFTIRHEEIQIVFKSNPELKDAALEKAKHEGVTLKAVLCMAMRAYVNDEMVMSMTRREEQWEQDDKPPTAKAPPKGKMKKGIKEGIKSNLNTKKGLAPTDLTSAFPYRNSTPFGHSASQNSHNATKGLAERVPTHSSPLKRRGGRRTEI